MSKIRTEISIESNESFIVRRKRYSVRSWCSRCERIAIHVLPTEAAFLAGLDLDKVIALVCDGTLHISELPEEAVFVCLTSLCFISHSGEDVNENSGFHEITLTDGFEDPTRLAT